MTDTGPLPPTGPTPPPGSPGVPPPPHPVDYGTAPVPGGPYTGPAPTKDDQTMAMLAHLLGVFTWFLGALIIWLIKKDQSPFVDDQGKEALNFQITMAIGWVVAGVTAFFCIGAFIALAIFVVNIVFCIMGALKANQGIAYRYPFNIRLVK